jgi:copper chaperone CopZ
VRIKIEILYFEGCPNHLPTAQLVRQVVAGLGLNAEVEEVELKNAEAAKEHRFLGSPSVQVNGVDIEPEARKRTDFGFSCRMYGASGVPLREWVESAIKEASRGPDCCRSDTETNQHNVSNPGSKGLWAVGVSVVSAVLASACCWLPLLLIGFGVSAGGVSAAFARVRPLFLGLCAVFLAAGFYLVYFRKAACAPDGTCAVPDPKFQRFNRAMLWFATVAVAVFVFFPSYAGFLLGERNPSEILAPANMTTRLLRIEGMTCEACASHLAAGLRTVPGVHGVSVDYSAGLATVVVDAASPPTDDVLLQAVEKVGYKAHFSTAGDE